ncbi:MAG: HD domain-containing protein [Intestinibacillus sp.]
MQNIISEAIAYDTGDPHRVHHLLKVYAFCRAIGQTEGLPADIQEVLEAAAVLHDIGIHNAETRHGSCGGKFQEQEGPAVARPILERCGAAPEQVERVCWLIAHHHTYGASDDVDFRILVEADFLVNAYEGNLSRAACEAIRERVFRTETGTRYLEQLFLSEPWQP